jgi:hypothetical protein
LIADDEAKLTLFGKDLLLSEVLEAASGKTPPHLRRKGQK